MFELVKQIPTAFISYSWDSTDHRDWVKRLGARLRSDGIDLTLDEWDLAPGDRLPHFMETSIRNSDFVLMICTPGYKAKSDARAGGVGYEGHIITAELMNDRNDRKFVPVLRQGAWRDAAPSCLLGKVYVDLSDEPYAEANYQQLLAALRGILPEPPPLETAPLTPVSRTIDMVGVTHQKVYADFLNAAVRVYEAARNRVRVVKQGGADAQVTLDRIEHDLEEQSRRARELHLEIDLFASEPVIKAAGEIEAWLIAVSHYSAAQGLEAVIESAHRQFIYESIPKFRTAVRNELSARECGK